MHHVVAVDYVTFCVDLCRSFHPLMFPFYVSVVPGMNAGTTATVALLRDSIELVVGSVGDSRAMLCRKGKVLKLTVDHTPERKDEKERYVGVTYNATFVS